MISSRQLGANFGRERIEAEQAHFLMAQFGQVSFHRQRPVVLGEHSHWDTPPRLPLLPIEFGHAQTKHVRAPRRIGHAPELGFHQN